MAEAAKHLVGEHDFAAFTQINHDRQSTIRTIYELAVERTAEHRVGFTVTGSGFLYNMVRIIAGTLHEVGRGRIEPSELPAILASKDRRRAGPTAAPDGLCLEWIRYPGDSPTNYRDKSCFLTLYDVTPLASSAPSDPHQGETKC